MIEPKLLWGIVTLLIFCPLLGGLPLIDWLLQLSGSNLRQLGTGNVSVSAAFYHGGQILGLLAVASEAFKGIAAVLLTRLFFPAGSAWEILALTTLALGRYALGRGAGTTNVVWGYWVHDWRVASLVTLIGGVSFTLVRQRQRGKYGVLVLLSVITMLLYPHQGDRILLSMLLGGVMAMIYQRLPDDLSLSARSAHSDSQATFRFFQGEKAILSLDRALNPQKVGHKAATLAQLKQWGYPVPDGWVLRPGDDPDLLVHHLRPTPATPLIVRSSAIGEDSPQASAAGQYLTIAHVTTPQQLEQALLQCLDSYDQPPAIAYRQQRHLTDEGMAVLVQIQIPGVFSGVAFSRDPIERWGDAVLVEALPGSASRVVSGRATPEQYRVIIPSVEPLVAGMGDVPLALVEQVAKLARELEERYHGIPQDVEWTYDGQQLWVLQTRPITTLLPIWTRKIAAEVIPGLIQPLTWSINHPLTCGVWGQLFTVVLGKRSQGLDFQATATLHASYAYFNATLLGQIFQNMGLPPESLEFLTRGTPFTKPSWTSTLRNVPGLWRLLQREWRLEQDFRIAQHRSFQPTLNHLKTVERDRLSVGELLDRIDLILETLHPATYFSILAPLSVALRQAVFRVADSDLDKSQQPEIQAMGSLQSLAVAAQHVLDTNPLITPQSADLFAQLAEQPEGGVILDQFQAFLDRFGHLSPASTNIAVPTWREDPHPVREMLAQWIGQTPQEATVSRVGDTPPRQHRNWVQRRLDLKGQVSELYSRLLAELRWSFVAIEERWLEEGILQRSGDIFFLVFPEVQRLVRFPDSLPLPLIRQTIAERRHQWEQDGRVLTPPMLVYGTQPLVSYAAPQPIAQHQEKGLLQGIGASPGVVEGRVKVLRTWQNLGRIDRETILVVPYTDPGWSPLLAQAGGLIAEVGGKLSHGAIVAREYGIPAVMDVHYATELLRDGQRVRIDGHQGTIEVL